MGIRRDIPLIIAWGSFWNLSASVCEVNEPDSRALVEVVVRRWFLDVLAEPRSIAIGPGIGDPGGPRPSGPSFHAKNGGGTCTSVIGEEI